jgi:hypothetical protein
MVNILTTVIMEYQIASVIASIDQGGAWSDEEVEAWSFPSQYSSPRKTPWEAETQARCWGERFHQGWSLPLQGRFPNKQAVPFGFVKEVLHLLLFPQKGRKFWLDANTFMKHKVTIPEKYAYLLGDTSGCKST